MKTLKVIFSSPLAVSSVLSVQWQKNQTEQQLQCFDCIFVECTRVCCSSKGYSWDKHEMVQDTIQSCYSDFLWTFQQSQWGRNCHLFLPHFHLVFSQAIKTFLFISAQPALPTDQLSQGEFFFHPLPVITALQSQTHQNSCWKQQESQPQLTEDNSNPDWIPNSSWCIGMQICCGMFAVKVHPAKSCTAFLLRACPPSPAQVEWVLSPRTAFLPQSKAALPFSPLHCPILYNASTVLSCMENPTKSVDEQKNCIIVMYFKLPHKHGNSERNIGCERGNSVQQAWCMIYVQDSGWRKRNTFFYYAASNGSHISKPGSHTDTFPSVKAIVSCYTYACTLANNMLHICTHLQTTKPGYSKMKAPWNENNTTRVRKIFVFLFHACFAWLSKNLVNIIQTLCSCKLQSEALINSFSKISALFSFCHNAPCEWGEGKKSVWFPSNVTI